MNSLGGDFAMPGLLLVKFSEVNANQYFCCFYIHFVNSVDACECDNVILHYCCCDVSCFHVHYTCVHVVVSVLSTCMDSLSFFTLLCFVVALLKYAINV